MTIEEKQAHDEWQQAIKGSDMARKEYVRLNEIAIEAVAIARMAASNKRITIKKGDNA